MKSRSCLADYPKTITIMALSIAKSGYIEYVLCSRIALVIYADVIV